MRIKKKAIDLMPGDRCTGPSVDFTEKGVVKNTVVVDKGVQINWEGGTYTVRPENYELEVEGMDEDELRRQEDARNTQVRIDLENAILIARQYKGAFESDEEIEEFVRDTLEDARENLDG